MKITDETIKYVSGLAKLQLTGEEQEQAKTDLASILSYMTKMNELDTDGIEPMSHAFPMKNVFREDVVVNGDDREFISKCASKEGRLFCRSQNSRVKGRYLLWKSQV